MREDYLWDKTGEDAEIERLEKSLRAFCYQTDAPPILPVRIIPFIKRPLRPIFRPVLAVAACLLIGLIGFGIWFQIGNQTLVKERDTVFVNPPPTVDFEAGPNLPTMGDIHFAGSKSTEKKLIPKRVVTPKVIKIKNTQPLVVSEKTVEVPKPKAIKTNHPPPPKEQTVALTEEEQFAYSQLMLALSITSSKLKMVKDKIDGSEAGNTILNKTESTK